MNFRNLLLHDSSPQFRKHHFRSIAIPRSSIHPSHQFPQQRYASLHHKSQHISTPPMVIMPGAPAFHRVFGFVYLQSSSYSFISIHNSTNKIINNKSSPSHPRSKRFHRLSTIACPPSLVHHPLPPFTISFTRSSIFRQGCPRFTVLT